MPIGLWHRLDFWARSSTPFLLTLAFGILGDRRPFGDNLLFHPLVIFMTAAGAGLIVLRIALARPVPEIIPDRKLAFGLLIGWAAFLAGNFLATQLFGR